MSDTSFLRRQNCRIDKLYSSHDWLNPPALEDGTILACLPIPLTVQIFFHSCLNSWILVGIDKQNTRFYNICSGLLSLKLQLVIWTSFVWKQHVWPLIILDGVYSCSNKEGNDGRNVKTSYKLSHYHFLFVFSTQRCFKLVLI